MRDFDFKFQAALNALASVEGIFLLGAFLAVVGVAVSFRWGKWAVFALLMFACSIHRPYGALALADPTLLPFLRPIDANGRILCTALLCLMIVPALRSAVGWRRGPLAAAVILWLFELIMALRDLSRGSVTEAMTELFVYTLIFLTLGWGLARWLQSRQDVDQAMWTIVLAGMLLVAVSLLQLGYNYDGGVPFGRFRGVTNNPNTIGMILLSCLFPASYLVGQGGRRKFWKVLLIGYLAVTVVLLIWTGSRGAMASAAIGIAVMYRRRLGHFAILVVAVGVAAYVLLSLFPQTQVGLTRFEGDLSSGREKVWARLWEEFLSYPFTGTQTKAGGECEYLRVAAGYGMIGLIPLAVFFITVGGSIRRLLPQCRGAGDDKSLLDMSLGALAATAVSSVGDGWALDMFAVAAYCLWVHLGVLAYLRDHVEARGGVQSSFSGEPQQEAAYEETEVYAEYEPAYGYESAHQVE